MKVFKKSLTTKAFLNYTGANLVIKFLNRVTALGKALWLNDASCVTSIPKPIRVHNIVRMVPAVDVINKFLCISLICWNWLDWILTNWTALFLHSITMFYLFASWGIQTLISTITRQKYYICSPIVKNFEAHLFHLHLQ